MDIVHFLTLIPVQIKQARSLSSGPKSLFSFDFLVFDILNYFAATETGCKATILLNGRKAIAPSKGAQLLLYKKFGRTPA